MYKLDLPVDMKETAAIERRKQRELERQSRIFNAKVRTIGVDVQALESQSAEKEWALEQERRREQFFAANMVRNDKICALLQKRQENDIKELNMRLNEFRKNYQSPDSRKEWDLNDPDSKKKDTAARVSDDDPRCGVSSVQKFLGEDLNEKERKTLQQEQIREWSKQQMLEKLQEEANLQQAKRINDLKLIENDQRTVQLALAEQECRKAINIANKDYNIALANEAAAKKDLETKQEEDDNKTEISNSIFGDMLTENPAVAQSAYGSHRVITDRWKGMSTSELNEIRHMQNQQLLEKKMLEEEERKREEELNRSRIAQAKVATIMEKQQDRLRRELARQQAEENLKLAAEQKKRSDYLNKEVYSNQPTAAFYEQFNKTSR